MQGSMWESYKEKWVDIKEYWGLEAIPRKLEDFVHLCVRIKIRTGKGEISKVSKQSNRSHLILSRKQRTTR